MSKFIDPLTDFGFKRLFGTEGGKAALIHLLNALLALEHPIVSLEYRNPEWVGEHELDRRAFFDLFCVDTIGRRFVVEIQRARQAFFKDRCLLYSAYPILEQASRGDWDYQLLPVYVVALLDFDFPAAEDGRDEYLHVVQLKDQRGRVFYDKYTQVYVQLPRFRKTLDALATDADRWLYLLRRLGELDARPPGFGGMYEEVFSRAALAKLSPGERAVYEEGMKHSRDIRNAFITAAAEGKAEGKAEGEAIGEARGKHAQAVEIAERLLTAGMPPGEVADFTGLALEEVLAVKARLDAQS